MSGRLRLADDAAAIAARLREIQAERAVAIAGCAPEAVTPSQIEMAIEAFRRAQTRALARLRSCTCAPSEAPRPCPHRYALSDCWRAAHAEPQLPLTADDLIERAIATKLVRHRVLSATWFLS